MGRTKKNVADTVVYTKRAVNWLEVARFYRTHSKEETILTYNFREDLKTLEGRNRLNRLLDNIESDALLQPIAREFAGLHLGQPPPGGFDFDAELFKALFFKYIKFNMAAQGKPNFTPIRINRQVINPLIPVVLATCKKSDAEAVGPGREYTKAMGRSFRERWYIDKNKGTLLEPPTLASLFAPPWEYTSYAIDHGYHLPPEPDSAGTSGFTVDSERVIVAEALDALSSSMPQKSNLPALLVRYSILRECNPFYPSHDYFMRLLGVYNKPISKTHMTPIMTVVHSVSALIDKGELQDCEIDSLLCEQLMDVFISSKELSAVRYTNQIVASAGSGSASESVLGNDDLPYHIPHNYTYEEFMAELLTRDSPFTSIDYTFATLLFQTTASGVPLTLAHAEAVKLLEDVSLRCISRNTDTKADLDREMASYFVNDGADDDQEEEEEFVNRNIAVLAVHDGDDESIDNDSVKDKTEFTGSVDSVSGEDAFANCESGGFEGLISQNSFQQYASLEGLQLSIESSVSMDFDDKHLLNKRKVVHFPTGSSPTPKQFKVAAEQQSVEIVQTSTSQAKLEITSIKDEMQHFLECTLPHCYSRYGTFIRKLNFGALKLKDGKTFKSARIAANSTLSKKHDGDKTVDNNSTSITDMFFHILNLHSQSTLIDSTLCRHFRTCVSFNIALNKKLKSCCVNRRYAVVEVQSDGSTCLMNSILTTLYMMKWFQDIKPSMSRPLISPLQLKQYIVAMIVMRCNERLINNEGVSFLSMYRSHHPSDRYLSEHPYSVLSLQDECDSVIRAADNLNVPTDEYTNKVAKAIRTLASLTSVDRIILAEAAVIVDEHVQKFKEHRSQVFSDFFLECKTGNLKQTHIEEMQLLHIWELLRVTGLLYDGSNASWQVFNAPPDTGTGDHQVCGDPDQLTVIIMKSFDRYFAVVDLEQLKDGYVSSEREERVCKKVKIVRNYPDPGAISLSNDNFATHVKDTVSRAWFLADQKATVYKHRRAPVTANDQKTKQYGKAGGVTKIGENGVIDV